MKRKQQRYASDCFATCIAMLADIPHSAAIKLTNPRHKRGQGYGMPYKNRDKLMRRLASKLDIKIRKRSIKTKLRDLKHNAQLSCTWMEDGIRWKHAVVWDAKHKRILCPMWSKPRSPSFYEKNKVFLFEFIQ